MASERTENRRLISNTSLSFYASCQGNPCEYPHILLILRETRGNGYTLAYDSQLHNDGVAAASSDGGPHW